MIVKLQDDTYHEEQTSEHDSVLTDVFRSKANHSTRARASREISAPGPQALC
jgi:hypothetical protein